MADRFISDTTTAFQLGQTVIAKVTNLDEEKRRFLITLKISEVISPEGDAQTRLINGLQERRAVNEMLALRGTHRLFGCVCEDRLSWCFISWFNACLTVNLRLFQTSGEVRCVYSV